MKNFIILVLLTFSSIGFSQNAGIIVGKVIDKELNNGPLIFANVSIKGTEIQSDSDITGLFLMENVAEGDYTLVCGFVGYEPEEIKIHVNSFEPTEVNFALRPTSISLNDISSLSNVSQIDTKTSTSLN